MILIAWHIRPCNFDKWYKLKCRKTFALNKIGSFQHQSPVVWDAQFIKTKISRSQNFLCFDGNVDCSAAEFISFYLNWFGVGQVMSQTNTDAVDVPCFWITYTLAVIDNGRRKENWKGVKIIRKKIQQHNCSLIE